MKDVFGAGVLADVTRPAMDRARRAARDSKQPTAVGMEHEGVRAGAIRPSVIAWDEVRVELREAVEQICVTVLIPVRGGPVGLAYRPSPILNTDGLGGVQYTGSPWTGHAVVCTREVDPQTDPEGIDRWRREWSTELARQVDATNGMISEHNAAVRAEVRRMVAARTATSRRVDDLTG